MAGVFDTLFGGGAEREAAEANRRLAAQYQTSSLDALNSTYGEGTAAINKGISAYDPLAALGTKYNAAGDVWMNALGVNGADAAKGAQSVFQTTPGYELTQNAALDAIDRRRAIGGMYASGNADIDTGNWITKNLYETQYQPWMAGLQGAAGMGGQYTAAAAQGQQGGYTNLANLAQTYGQNQTNVYGNNMNTNVAANNQQAAGEAAGAKNLLGAGLSIAGAAFGMPGLGSSFTGGGGGGGGGAYSGGSYNFSGSPLGQGLSKLGGMFGFG
ncbi:MULTISPECIES: hypothetical protein [Bradyrhizobium]|uniref:hypothetical protein n=1 Tax=Bradyrhizobium TaxID=374 RepID=UPI00040F3B1B|nr:MULTISPECIES: hypothetical protein [Bradyrhizobium]MBR1002298.1 hypothetical protein [Bradyrhizobium liaoningense]MCP1740882.1 hypothetical protein [Bradyrhizobium japonicum]MCP1858551.1 hypothetical protein [Bradyrhizobium japonicum]MCP1889370.1 hypothetical protein [Bradyrhizobium japonicum]MCW2322348.1 hypothetical protein [Bradyrhizobium japonicum]